MFGFLLPLPFIGGLGARVAIVVLILYALLPIVRTTTAGIALASIASLVEAGHGAGHDAAAAAARRCELPLALPSIVAGIRVAAVIGVGTATIAAAVGAGGLGEYIFRGLSMVDPTVILAGAIPSAVLALSLDGGADARRARGARRQPVAAGAGAVACRRLVAVAVAGGGRAGRRRRAPDAERRSASARRTSPSRSSSASSLAQTIEARPALRGRAAPESRRHVHLRSRAALRRHRRLRRVHRHGAHRDLPSAASIPIRAACFDDVRARYADAGLTLLDPLGFENTFAILVRGDDARAARAADDRGCRAARAALAGGLRLRVPPARRTAIPGLAKAYGLRSPRRRAPWTCRSSTARSPIGRSISIAGDATSGLIDAYGLVMLEDNRHYFPPYDAVAGRAAARRCSRIRRSARRWRALGGPYHVADMRRMNHAVDAERRDPADVAREFLAARR